jgi:arylsulfatase A-like enzyme/Flp pilus assembly protein TadD
LRSASPAARPPAAGASLPARLRALAAFTLLAIAAATACSKQEPGGFGRGSAPRNLLLITIDTLRADRVGCYGYPGARTPRLDRLAAEGARFETAIAPVPLTLPSHTSILTGRYPAAHGVHSNGRERLPAEVPTLAGSLAGLFPRRGAVVASASLDRLFGLDRGFTEYDDRMPPGPADGILTQRERRAEEVARLSIQWLAAAGEPFFLWVHLFDPHAPYEAPARWRAGTTDPYDAEVAYADDAVGRLLDALAATGALERTLVVVAGDHGEDLNDHGEPTHGVFLYDSSVRVPLLFRYPAGIGAGRVVPGLARLIDLMPTVLELLGVAPPPGVQGASLVPLLTGASDDLRLEAFLETRLPAQQYGWSALRALRGRDWKYVSAPEPELYDLAADPGERLNLAGRQLQRSAGLRARLEEAAAGAGSSQAGPARPNPELQRQLESLGYVGGRAEGAPPLSGPDPKRMAHLLPVLDQGVLAFESRHFDQAEPVLRSILSENPGNVFARRLLARSLLALRRPAEGEREYRRLLEDAPNDAEALNTLGTLALRAGRFEEAEKRFEAARQASPWDPRIRSNLAFLVARRGQFAEAERMLEEILADNPRFVDAALNLAGLRRRLGRPTEAEQTLRALLREVPGEPAALQALSGLLKEQGRGEEAHRLLEVKAR